MAVRAITESVVLIAAFSAAACVAPKRAPYRAPPAQCSEGLPDPEAPDWFDRRSAQLPKDSDFKDYARRLKKAVRPVWSDKVERLAWEKDPQGRCLCSDRRAIVELTIDRSGTILAGRIVQTSQVGFVDQSALEAIHEIGQVKDPPASLFGDEETARFSFGFVLGLNKRFERRTCELVSPHESILGN